MTIHNWFLPHKDTHQKAHLISWEATLIYVLLFILLQVSFSVLGYTKPGILGVSSSIDYKKIIALTNEERTKTGLTPVSENSTLDQAAYAKAKNMFEENYWAHFAPSGKSPWDFILGSGYKFTYAGENLAKNFTTSEEVVTAWMNSPSHRDNLLGSKYKEIGLAVVDGVLNGQQTTLVVQMFGTTTQPIAKVETTSPPVQNTPAPKPPAQVLVSGEKINVTKQDYQKERVQPLSVASVTNQPTFKSLINPYQFFKTSALMLIVFMAIILFLDILVLYRRGVLRVSSSHMAHMSLLAVSAAALITTGPGKIL